MMADLAKSEIFDDDCCATELLIQKVNEDLPTEEKYSEDEFEQALNKMSDKNQLMIAEGKVWIV